MTIASLDRNATDPGRGAFDPVNTSAAPLFPRTQRKLPSGHKPAVPSSGRKLTKARRRLELRIRRFETLSPNSKGYHKPGSMNRHKTASLKTRR